MNEVGILADDAESGVERLVPGEVDAHVGEVAVEGGAGGVVAEGDLVGRRPFDAVQQAPVAAVVVHQGGQVGADVEADRSPLNLVVPWLVALLAREETGIKSN